MSLGSLFLNSNVNRCARNVAPLLLAARQGHWMRGKPPGVARTLEQRLRDENKEDPELTKRVNIGFAKLRPSRSEQVRERLEHMQVRRADTELEKRARSNTLLIDLDQVQQEYNKSTRPYDLRTIADHYGIFSDLFGCAYFVPRVPLSIKYELEAGVFSPVHCGNVIKPAEAANAPQVQFDGTADPTTGEKVKGDCFWTLIATNPDGGLTQDDTKRECIHWFIGNIPNGDVEKGEVLVKYLQPFPPKGVGFQRFVFVLYKQNTKLDFSPYKVEEADGIDLAKRAFNTLEFYRALQNDMKPAGLAFYQSDWDKSLKKFFHHVLDIPEPIYEYDFPAPYLSDQKFFPLRQPFNLYMDKHRDIKQVNKEYLQRKLANTHPFDGPEPPLRYPNAHPIRDVPSWLRTELKKRRLGIGRINDY